MLKKVLTLSLLTILFVSLTAFDFPSDYVDIRDVETPYDLYYMDDAEFVSLTDIEFNEDQEIYTLTLENVNGENAFDIYVTSIDNSKDIDRPSSYMSEGSEYDDFVSNNNLELETELDEAVGATQDIQLETNEAVILVYELTELDRHEIHEEYKLLYYEELPTVFEEVGGALVGIVTAGSSVFVSTFDGLLDVFWDADANDGDGALNWIAYVAVLPIGFFLVRWGIRKVLGMIQQRM